MLHAYVRYSYNWTDSAADTLLLVYFTSLIAGREDLELLVDISSHSTRRRLKGVHIPVSLAYPSPKHGHDQA